MTDFETRLAEAKRHLRATSLDGIQRRAVPTTFEVRAAGDSYEVVGHGAVFNSLSENLGGFREKIEPGAFAKVLDKDPDVRALFNHDPNLVLARTTVSEGPGSLSVAEDDTGLAYSFTPTPTTYAADLRANLDAKVVNQSSFAFRVARGGDTWDEDEESGLLIRTITEFSGLYDVSPVTYPAYPAADSGLASLRCIRCNETCQTVESEGGLCEGCQSSSPESERESERVAATTDDMAEQGAADGTARERRKRDLALREQVANS